MEFNIGLVSSLQLFYVALLASIASAANATLATAKNMKRQGWTPEPNCGRGTAAIIWQCFTTIGLCTYVTLHLSIPPLRLSGTATFVRKLFWVSIGLVLPEFVCFVALLQYKDAKLFREACRIMNFHISMAQAFFILSGGVAIRKLQDYGISAGGGYRRPSEEFDIDDDTIWIYDPQYTDSENKKTDLVVTARNVLPDDQIHDRSKANIVAKAITSVQALWTLLQIVTRGAQGLTISVMEYATLAYIAVAAVSFGLWWEKAYDVGTFHVIDAQEATRQGQDRFTDWSARDWQPISGGAYWHQHRAWWFDSASKRTNTFKSPLYNAIGIDMPRSNFRGSSALRFFVTLTAVFGGIHCAAWLYPFASAAEIWLWRLCSILTAILPVLTLLLPVIFPKEPSSVVAFFEGVLFIVFPALYLCVRLCMIIECFVAFRDAPVGIYAQVDWSEYLPHIA
ncbi:hypothetical protein MMC28_002920 [Mycoblastus sanguinarius]|nr:hypothetical protein [Mycoblastus sanguinarius]